MGNSGKIDFPSHMKTIHHEWLSQSGDDDVAIELSMVDLMNVAIGGSPYSAMVALDPSAELTAMDTAVSAFNTRVDAIDPDGDWEDAVDAAVAKLDGAVVDDTYVDADITAFGNNLDDQIENIVLPRFHGGMRDVNAVMSSAFVMGESIIEGMRDRDVAKYGTELRVKLNGQRNEFVMRGVESILKNLMTVPEMEKSVAHYTIEAKRLRIVAEKEQKDSNNEISVDDGRWDLETFQYGANLLASIGGGTMVPKNSNKGMSSAQSAIGGALGGAAAGAAAGSMAGPGGAGIVALIGGVVGGLGGIL